MRASSPGLDQPFFVGTFVEADDLGTYVMKFRGAGQGPKVLAAEIIAGELGRRLGLPVPDLVLTAPRSTIVQTGPAHAGLTNDPGAELENLLDKLVRTARS